MESTSNHGGIQQLLAAEHEAQQIVNAARTGNHNLLSETIKASYIWLSYLSYIYTMPLVWLAISFLLVFIFLYSLCCDRVQIIFNKTKC